MEFNIGDYATTNDKNRNTNIEVGSMVKILRRINLGYADGSTREEILYSVEVIKTSETYTLDDRMLEPYELKNTPEYFEDL